jgi:hypothetical protein
LQNRRIHAEIGQNLREKKIFVLKLQGNFRPENRRQGDHFLHKIQPIVQEQYLTPNGGNLF